MTAEVFDRLLYTDCLPGTGRGAGGGFQVQAQSSGVDSGQSKLAVGSLLYEVQVPWLNQRRPVGEFPLGFAHARGEGYGTAQSRYTGKAAAGGRDGNHLADCLLTRNADCYGAIRPAQLWRAPLWRDEPWPDKECPQLDAADLESGPLTADFVADWARARPERPAVLARLLTLLEDPAGKRVVIVSDEADEAVTWIAAATLLLPARLALDVSFKVFSSIPLRSEHRVTAAPAALFPQITPGRGGASFVLDARTCAADEGAVSERAAFFTEKFAAGGDPYDVVDAVELADTLGDPGQLLGGHDAMITAWALTRPDDPPAEAAALSRWLFSAPPPLLGEYGPAVAGILLAAAPPAATLRWIDRAVSLNRLAADPAAVRVQLLAAELAEIHSPGEGTIPLQEALPAAGLGGEAYRDAESKISSAILLGSDQQADLLLCLARRHGITPDLPALRDRLDLFVSAWLDRPGRYHPDGWALRAELLDQAHDALRARLLSGGTAAVAGAIRQLGRHFGDRVDMSDPLDRHIQASLIAVRGQPGRLDQLRQLLAGLARVAGSPAQAADAAAGLQRALMEWNAVDGEVALTVLTELPDELSAEPAFSALAAEQLSRLSEKPSRKLLDLLARLDRQGKAPTSGRLAGLLASDKQVRTFIRRAHEERARTDTAYMQGSAALLRQADPAVVRERLDEVLAACLQGHWYLGATVLASLKSPLPRLLVERWAQTLGTRDLVEDGVWCVSCLDYEDLSERRQEQVASAFREYAKTLPAKDSDTWYQEVARRIGPQRRDLWESVFTVEPSRPRINLWRSRDGGRS